MRDYGSVSPRFWTGSTGRSLRGHQEAQIVAVYLMTSPGSHMIGIYSLALPTMCHETGLTMEGASKGLARLSEAGFAYFDEEEEVVWVPEMASFQIGEELHDGDKRIKGVQNELDKFKKSRFYNAFLDRYARPFRLKAKHIKAGQTQAPSKPLPSPTEARTGSGQDQDQKNLPAEEPPAAAGQSILVPQAAMPSPGKPKAKRESKAKPGFAVVREHFESLSKARTGEDYQWSAAASVGCNSLLVSLGEDTERCRRYLDGAFALADRQAAAGDAFLASNLSMAYLGSSDGINRVRNALVAERAAKSSCPPRVNDGIPTAAESAARIRRQEEELAAARAKETPESKAKIQELIAATARSLGVRA